MVITMREILLNVCLMAIALSLFKMLLPEGSAKKQTDFMVSCFFLAGFAFFFTSGRVNFASEFETDGLFDNIPYINFEEEYNKAQSHAVEKEISHQLTRILAEEEIFVRQISVNVNISDKYSISINEIRVVLTKEGDEENEEEIERLRESFRIIQREVGDEILITGEFKTDEA
ncbi:MAG: hypothetical protein FWG83_00355 [Oscillospiraceae bacterium]|nr:hypothetical protein [Oscillospiraceae bacterium]